MKVYLSLLFRVSPLYTRYVVSLLLSYVIIYITLLVGARTLPGQNPDEKRDISIFSLG